MKKAVFVTGLAVMASSASALADDAESLATQLANPLAKLISIPIQGNYNSGYGPLEDGQQVLTNVQPVIPFNINDEWNLISRTILPIVWQNDMFPGAGTQFGLGNTTQSLFLSPAKTVNGITWGVGPVLYVPTATDELLGPDTFGLGPTAVALWQGKGWTVGVLANQIWSVTGDEQDEINASYIQPFLSYTTPDAWTFTLNTEFDLQLAQRRMERAHQRRGLQDREDRRQAARQLLRRCPLLGRHTGRCGPRRLGRPFRLHGATAQGGLTRPRSTQLTSNANGRSGVEIAPPEMCFEMAGVERLARCLLHDPRRREHRGL